jgi:hypothetical protein
MERKANQDNSNKTWLTPQSVVSLVKRRVYRFSENPSDHALLEEIDNLHLAKGKISARSMELLVKYLNDLDHSSATVLETARLAEAENIDVKAAVRDRVNYETQSNYKKLEPKKVIFIVGSPRSGTSFLYNLLAFQGNFSYFTNVSHHIWPYYNLKHLVTREHFQTLGKDFFQIDTKETRLMNHIVFPDEAEHVFSRAIPSYTLLRRNQYLLRKPLVKNPEILTSSVQKHVEVFNSDMFLCKSPFNSFRISELAEIFGTRALFIHIYRNGYSAADSIRDNGFKYFTKLDRTDDPAIFWARHIDGILAHRKNVRMYHLSYDKLVANTLQQVNKLFDWLEIPTKRLVLGTRYLRDSRSAILTTNTSNAIIDKYNSLLGDIDDK